MRIKVIMTDKAMADKIYIEPLTINTIKRIIEKEKPDLVIMDEFQRFKYLINSENNSEITTIW